jgi:hypothetical protein
MALRREEFHYEPDERRQAMDETQSTRQHVTIDLSLARYNQIKTEAHQRDQSISEYIGNVLNQSLPEEVAEVQQPRPMSPEMLAKMMTARQQIRSNTKGHIFEDSTELIRQMRNERSEELDRR